MQSGVRTAGKIVFRVDASERIGTGHVMRCLCLADRLREKGFKTIFLSRHMIPHLRASIEARHHGFMALPHEPSAEIEITSHYGEWLGTSEVQDAQDTERCLSGMSVDWLVVDHYALGLAWEKLLRPIVGRILVIDDLANRHHDCDMLLDQNCSPDLQRRYADLTPIGTDLLLGPRYSLLREEFKFLRAQVTPRSGRVNRILVLYGGVDAINLTGLTTNALVAAAISGIEIDVVIGAQHPARLRIIEACRKAGFSLHEQSDKIAQLMAMADFSFGAGGSTCWERCCMGLPAALLKVAENQSSNIRALKDLGACLDLGEAQSCGETEILACVKKILDTPDDLKKMSERAFDLVDGGGVERVLQHMGI
jgi:UDP-2,4-diacetamido-2,4,6-trideoxy-beta-L-altropyranose hydrolase